VDIGGPYSETSNHRKYWLMVVDDYSRKNWSYYLKHKNNIGEPLSQLFTKLKGGGMP